MNICYIAIVRLHILFLCIIFKADTPKVEEQNAGYRKDTSEYITLECLPECLRLFLDLSVFFKSPLRPFRFVWIINVCQTVSVNKNWILLYIYDYVLQKMYWANALICTKMENRAVLFLCIKDDYSLARRPQGGDKWLANKKYLWNLKTFELFQRHLYLHNNSYIMLILWQYSW